MAVKQTGMQDSRGVLAADKLELVADAYPWFAAADNDATVSINQAVGVADLAELPADVEFSHITYSCESDPDAGALLEIVAGGTTAVWHFLAYKGERSLPIGFRFKAGTLNNKVRIVGAGAAVGVTLCLHNPR